MKRVMRLLLVIVLSLGLLGCSKDEPKPSENEGGEVSQIDLMEKYDDELTEFNRLCLDVEAYVKAEGEDFKINLSEITVKEINSRHVEFTAPINNIYDYDFVVIFKRTDGALYSLDVSTPSNKGKDPSFYGDIWMRALEGIIKSKYVGLSIDEYTSIVDQVRKVIEDYQTGEKINEDLTFLDLERIKTSVIMGDSFVFRLYFE